MRNVFNFLFLSQSASKARVHIAKLGSTAQKSILEDPLKCGLEAMLGWSAVCS